MIKEKFHHFLLNLKSNLKNNIFITVLFCLAIFLPDQVAKYFYDININLEPLFLLGVILFAFILSYANKIVASIFIILIIIMELIELNFTVYFGSPIDATDIANIVREYRDVFDVSYLRETGVIVAVILGIYALLLYKIFHLQRAKIKWIWIVLILMSIHKPYHAIKMSHDIWYFQPSITRPSLKNSINTFSYFFFRYLPRGYEQKSIDYIPYKVTKTDSKVENVLLIFGESLYSEHLPMFGYERQTFPKITKILQDKNWQSAQTISGGIATATSTLLFFNLMREPANLSIVKSGDANLFRIAKENGFKTYYFSNQESRLTKGLGAKYIDQIITHDSNPIFFAKHQDEGLSLLLDDLDLKSGKNFIVLHMRSPHSPYENRYKGREDEFEKFLPTDSLSGRLTYVVNTYDNALLYTDEVISKIIKNFEKLAIDSNYRIYVTADHGQLFDYNGMWGHNNLVIEQSKVPLFLKNSQKKLPKTISHYEIGKMIAEDLGASIKNPNEDNTFYLHGNNVDFPYNFIQYRIDGNNITEVREGNTGEEK